MTAVTRALAAFALAILLPPLAACQALSPDPLKIDRTPQVEATTSTAPAATPLPSPTPSASPTLTPSAVPRPEHVVVVMLENKHRSTVIDSPDAPYLNSLAASGANLTGSYGVTHPSQPNYLALFSGSTHGVTSDACPKNFPTADNLGRQLLDAGLTFTGYAESLPSAGSRTCVRGDYQRKHNPWVDFGNLPASVNQPFSAFPTDYSKLPTVAFVTPNMCNDMHDCSVATGDSWLENHLDGYARWARSHNSLLVVTFDENSGGTVNQIPTIVVGGPVRHGTYPEQLNHYGLLRTIEDAYALPALGNAAAAEPLRTIWSTSPKTPPAPIVPVNPSFELGLAGWAVGGSATSVATSRHGGTLAVRAGRSGASKGDSTISQTFTVPSGRSRLSVTWLGRCQDKRAKAWASATLKPHDGSAPIVLLPRTCRKTGGWRAVSAKVQAGGTYTLALVNHDDGVARTPNRSYFDDVQLD